MERWTAVKENQNYEVSTRGNVRKINPEVKQIIKTTNKAGYKYVCLFSKSKRSMRLVHRLMGEAFIPNPLNKKEINHLNFIRDDNKIENLEWATHAENMAHSKKDGRRVGMGGRPPKLSIEDVLQIREMFIVNPLLNKPQVAKTYGVCPQHIHSILERKVWKLI